MTTESHSGELPLDFFSSSERHEPDLGADAMREYEGAALIGGEQLRSSGFFVNIVSMRPIRQQPLDNPTILVVEDDPGTSAVIDAILRKQGFTTRIAANLQGILRGMNAKPRPDMILLDILLPDANGFAVLDRMRRHPDLRDIPVVMLSSLSDSADVAKGLALGASGYLSKPARPQALVQAVRGVLGLA